MCEEKRCEAALWGEGASAEEREGERCERRGKSRGSAQRAGGGWTELVEEEEARRALLGTLTSAPSCTSEATHAALPPSRAANMIADRSPCRVHKNVLLARKSNQCASRRAGAG